VASLPKNRKTEIHMKIKNKYTKRSIRFLELYKHDNWQIKIYSISNKNEFISNEIVAIVKENLTNWLSKSSNYELETFDIANLIIHEGREGYFVLTNWWIDDEMLQNHAYFSTYDNPTHFSNFSDKGIIACTWELAIICFERDSWIRNVLMKNDNPDFVNYLNEVINIDL
jgi:hypothetical protein